MEEKDEKYLDPNFKIGYGKRLIGFENKTNNFVSFEAVISQKGHSAKTGAGVQGGKLEGVTSFKTAKTYNDKIVLAYLESNMALYMLKDGTIVKDMQDNVTKDL